MPDRSIARSLDRRRTLTMSSGWITHVAPMPERPPFMNGLTAFQTSLSLRAISIGVRRRPESRSGMNECSERRDDRSSPLAASFQSDLARSRAADLRQTRATRLQCGRSTKEVSRTASRALHPSRGAPFGRARRGRARAVEPSPRSRSARARTVESNAESTARIDPGSERRGVGAIDRSRAKKTTPDINRPARRST